MISGQVMERAGSAEGCTLTAPGCSEKQFGPPAKPAARAEFELRLAVSGHGTQLPGKEVVRGPGSADSHFAVLQLLSGGAVAVLVLLDRLGIDEMGDVDEHPLGGDLLAAHFLFEGIKQLVDLNREGAGFGLALAFPGGFDAEF